MLVTFASAQDIPVNADQWNALDPDARAELETALRSAGALVEGARIVPDPSVDPIPVPEDDPDAIGLSVGAVAHNAVRQVLWKPARRNAGTSRSWLPRTRSRSTGHSARSSTKRSSRPASGWAMSPRQMTVSPTPTRRLQFRSR